MKPRHTPFQLYPLDIAGLLGLGVVALGLFFGLYQPQRATAAEAEDLRATVARERAQLQTTQQHLRTLLRHTRKLQQTMAAYEQPPPHVAQLHDVQHGIVATARAAGLAVTAVLPSELQTRPECLTSDIEIRAEGNATAFIAALDQLGRAYPHHALRGFSLKQPVAGADSACSIAMQLQLFVLPKTAQPVVAAAGEPTP